MAQVPSRRSWGQRAVAPRVRARRGELRVALTAARAVAARANVLHRLGRHLVPPHTPNVCSWDRTRIVAPLALSYFTDLRRLRNPPSELRYRHQSIAGPGAATRQAI